ADMLRNAAGLTRGDVRLANRVEQAGFAVIDVAHHSDDGRTRLEIFLGLFLGDFEHHFVFERDDGDDAVEGFGELRSGRDIERLIDAGKDPLVEKHFKQILGAHVEFFRKLADGDAFRDGDVARGTRLRGGDNGSGAAVSCSRALPGRMKLAFAFQFALVNDRALALRGFARVQGLSGLGFGRHFVRKGGKHAGTAGHARSWARAGWNGAGPLPETAILWSACSTRTGSELSALGWAGLLRAHRLSRARAAGARGTRRSGERAAIAGRQGAAISSRHWPSRS